MTEPTPWFALIGIVLIGLAVPMILRRVPPNPAYGLRVPATYKDEQVWYDANAASGWDMVWFGVFLVLFGVLPPWFGWSGESHWLAWGVSSGAGALLMAVLGWRRANRMLAARSKAVHKEGG